MKGAVKFRRNFDPKYKGTKWENETGEKVTVPSMALTVKELMVRHTRGLETGVPTREGYYMEEGEEVPRILDLTDLVERRERLEERTKEINKAIKDERARIKRETKAAKDAESGGDTSKGLDKGEKPKSEDKTTSKES